MRLASDLHFGAAPRFNRGDRTTDTETSTCPARHITERCLAPAQTDCDICTARLEVQGEHGKLSGEVLEAREETPRTSSEEVEAALIPVARQAAEMAEPKRHPRRTT